jgi:hypothetical protein
MFTIAALTLALAPTPLPASSCPKFKIDQAYERSTTIFVGRAVSSTESNPEVNRVMTFTTFAVEKTWKGTPEDGAITVGTLGGQGITYGGEVQFQIGATYLVFAEGDPLRTSSCAAWPIRDMRARDAIEWLGTPLSNVP